MNGGLREIQDNLARMAADLAARRAQMAQGLAIDLADLETKIGAICVDVVNARPQSSCFLPSLQHLVAQLDELGAGLKQRHKTG